MHNGKWEERLLLVPWKPTFLCKSVFPILFILQRKYTAKTYNLPCYQSSRCIWTMLLGTWCNFWGVLHRVSSWTWWSWWIPFNSYILWLYDSKWNTPALLFLEEQVVSWVGNKTEKSMLILCHTKLSIQEILVFVVVLITSLGEKGHNHP